MQKEERKFENSVLFEGMTSIRALIAAMEKNVSDRKIEKILYTKENAAKNAKEIGYLRAVSTKYDFVLEETTAASMENIAIGTSHGGLFAIGTPRTVPTFSEDSLPSSRFLTLIQGIEDPYNFGYAIRSLYACGVDGILLPERNWMSAAGVVCRSSAGASEELPMFTADPLGAANLLKKRGFSIICADERTDDLLGETEMKFPLLLIVGGEKRGISRSLLDVCDKLVKIPYAREFRASLSAASATTMFAYEIMRQNKS